MVEVDQSGKFEQLNTHTVVACANEKSGAILISASVKRRLIQRLRKSLIPRKDLIAILFTVLIFIALDTLDDLPATIIIDEEYTGKEEVIRESLQKLIAHKTRGKWQGYIRFKQVGKSSPAHKLAWEVHRKKKTALKKISEKEFTTLLEIA